MIQVKEEALAPIMKWPGGKEQELSILLPFIPSFRRYYEPFVGGGAVFFALRAQENFINDRASDLVQCYRMVAGRDAAFFQALDTLLNSWQAISDLVDGHAEELLAVYKAFRNAQKGAESAGLEAWLTAFLLNHRAALSDMCLPGSLAGSETFFLELRRNFQNKTLRMRRLEQQKWLLPEDDVLANIESSFKSAFYMYARHCLNHWDEYRFPAGVVSALFFFVRENAYASMFRYNSKGAMNVPYGGVSYNRKNLARKVSQLRSSDLQAYLSTTVIENLDFEVFLTKYPPQEGDFLFLDPPYHSAFNTYQRNQFDERDQERLASYLLNRCPAKFLLVIKNTPFIQSLYSQRGLQIRSFEKKYLVNFQNRNNRSTEHLVITNY